jgi:hypothetical protein
VAVLRSASSSDSGRGRLTERGRGRGRGTERGRGRCRLAERGRGRPTSRRAPTVARSTDAAAAAALEDWLARDCLVYLEALDNFARDPRAKQRLDVAEEHVLVDADERNRVALHAGSTGSADSVDIVLSHHRQLEVDDMR